MRDILALRLETLIERKKDTDYKLTVPKQAEGMGIPYPTLVKYLKAKSSCPAENIFKIAKYYEVSADYLLGIVDHPTTDKDLNAVCEFTGLSEKAVATLQTIKSENKQTWCMDVLNSLIEAGDFDALLYFITQYSTKQNKDLQVKNYVISSNDIEETKAQNTLHDIMKDLKAQYQDKEDYRPAYQFLYSCHQSGKCSDKDFERIEKEFDRGDFSELQ